MQRAWMVPAAEPVATNNSICYLKVLCMQEGQCVLSADIVTFSRGYTTCLHSNLQSFDYRKSFLKKYLFKLPKANTILCNPHFQIWYNRQHCNKKINLQKSSAHSAKMNTRFCFRIPCIQNIFRSKIFPLWSKRKYVFTACTGTY